MPFRTRLTDLLEIEHPILLAPMGSAAGGRLAAAVTHAGGLGLIGSGYASTKAIRQELTEAGNARVGIGFILWALERNPAALDVALEARPEAVMLSAVLTIIMVLVYLYVPVGDTALLLLGIPLNAAILMKFAPMGPFMTELYPTDIRGTGQGFCYNAGRAIGSVFMTVIGFATAVMPLGSAIALFSTIAHGLMIVMLLLLPETRGRAIASL